MTDCLKTGLAGFGSTHRITAPVPRGHKNWSQNIGRDRVTEAILLVSFKLGYNWFNRLFKHYPVCLARDRIRFIRPDGTPGGKAKVASAFFYFGPNLPAFRSTVYAVAKGREAKAIALKEQRTLKCPEN
jgi:hypothetical protein